MLVEVDGQALIVDRRSARAFALNDTAALLWQVFDCEGTIDQIAEDVADIFEVDAESVAAEIVDLVGALEYIGALEGSEAEPATLPQAPEDCADEEPAERDPFAEPPYIRVPPNN
jgi:hypothetical protein